MSILKFGFRTDPQNHQISKETIDAVEHIISEVGAELHDDLVQKLSIIKLHLDKIERSSYDPIETRETVIKMQTSFDAVVNSVRRISRQFLPLKMENDTFERLVEALCQNLDMPDTVRIHTSFSGDSSRLEPKTETYLLRMIQEIIHNSFRHSAAWNVWVDIVWSEKRLRIQVEDDGSGFSKMPEFIQRLKMKHNTLRLRAETIGAKITYKQGKKGLLSIVELPL